MAENTGNGRNSQRVRSRISTHEEFRRRRGYSVTGLAKAIGYSHTYVSRVEGGDVRPSPRYRKVVSKLLGIPEALLFDSDLGT